MNWETGWICGGATCGWMFATKGQKKNLNLCMNWENIVYSKDKRRPVYSEFLPLNNNILDFISYLSLYSWKLLFLHSNLFFVCLITKLYLTLATPWIVNHQAPLSLGFPRQEYGSFFRGSSQPRERTCVVCLASVSFTTELPGICVCFDTHTEWKDQIILSLFSNSKPRSVCVRSDAQLRPPLWHPHACSLPGSSATGFLRQEYWGVCCFLLQGAFPA